MTQVAIGLMKYVARLERRFSSFSLSPSCRPVHLSFLIFFSKFQDNGTRRLNSFIEEFILYSLQHCIYLATVVVACLWKYTKCPVRNVLGIIASWRDFVVQNL